VNLGSGCPGIRGSAERQVFAGRSGVGREVQLPHGARAWTRRCQPYHYRQRVHGSAVIHHAGIPLKPGGGKRQRLIGVGIDLEIDDHVRGAVAPRHRPARGDIKLVILIGRRVRCRGEYGRSVRQGGGCCKQSKRDAIVGASPLKRSPGGLYEDERELRDLARHAEVEGDVVSSAKTYSRDAAIKPRLDQQGAIAWVSPRDDRV